jgi:hypothetical protein
MPPTFPSNRRSRAPAGRWAAVWAGLCGLALGAPAPAQAPDAPVVYWRQRDMTIPFEMPAGNRRIQEVQLWYSVDQGRTWKLYRVAKPDQRGFPFTFARDGWYWFTVAERDDQGLLNPPSMSRALPHLKIYYDTQPLLVTLRQVPARDGALAVEWDVRDETLNLQTLRLEARTGAGPWQPLGGVQPRARDQFSWTPAAFGAVEVKLALTDFQGNPRETTLTLSPNAAPGGRPQGQLQDARPAPALRPGDKVEVVGNKLVQVNYGVSKVGKSGYVAELWMTTDGRPWTKVSQQEDRNNDKGTPARAGTLFQWLSPGPGLYGLKLVTRSGVESRDLSPRVGDAPDLWVEVDLTKPEVVLRELVVGRDADHGKLFISWQANDKNLAERPITLAYAERPDGPWTPITPPTASLENTGQYTWTMPTEVPVKVFIRVQAQDKAANVGTAEAREPVAVDLCRPEGQITSVSAGPPAGGAEPPNPGR